MVDRGSFEKSILSPAIAGQAPAEVFRDGTHTAPRI
jgi:hypothetical protein